MSNNVIVQFVGFEVEALVREYNFHVRQAFERDLRIYADNCKRGINSRRVRYQDASRDLLSKAPP